MNIELEDCGVFCFMPIIIMIIDIVPYIYLQDRFLPIANVAKIMKKSVPNTGKVWPTYAFYTPHDLEII